LAKCSARLGLATCDYSAKLQPNFSSNLASLAALQLRRLVLATDVDLKLRY